MNNKEAIENLKYLISGDCCDTQMDYVDEIDMAIEALEKQIPKKPNDISTYEGWVVKGEEGYFFWNMPVLQKPCNY